MYMEKPSISLITVSLNEEQHLQRLWEAVQQMSCLDEADVEMILVDGGSSDETVTKAKSIGFDQVLEIRGGTIPACRNRGARNAHGSWFAYLDADCEPDKGWFKHVLSYLRDGEPVAIGWPVSPPKPTTWVQRAWHFHWVTKNARFTERNGRQVVLCAAFRLLTTRNLVVHRSLFDDLKGFDEHLFTGEDTDFVFRAYHAGKTVVADPGLQVYHHGEPATLRAFYRQQTWHANRASYARILRNPRGRTGRNAPRFAVLFLAGLVLTSVALCSALIMHTPWPLAGMLPLLLLIVGPALLLSWRGRTILFFFPLCVLYGLYGLARALDLLGFYRRKQSWKSADAPR